MQPQRRGLHSAAGRCARIVPKGPRSLPNLYYKQPIYSMTSTALSVAENVQEVSCVNAVAVTSVDESQYSKQLQENVSKLKEMFREFDPPELEVFESPPSHYRMRAEFTVEQRDGEMRYVMFNKSPAAPEPPSGHDIDDEVAPDANAAASTSAPTAAPSVGKGKGKGKGRSTGTRRIIVERFPVASRQVNELMEVVRQECVKCPELSGRLFQANFHSTLVGDALVTLIYHRKLGSEWTAAAERLRDALAATPTAAATGRRPHVIGRSRKQKLELSAAFVEEQLEVRGHRYVQRQVEGAFSQPNAVVCQHMVGWALDVTRQPFTGAGGGGDGGGGIEVGRHDEQHEGGRGSDAGGEVEIAPPHDDLLELYCGNGNFTVPLAQNFRHVIATEVSKASVDAARWNLMANGVGNVFLARMSSEEFAETMRARGTRRRLKGLAPWEELRLRTVLVDPPRAGLDNFTVELLKEFDRIVYISCNPKTLAINLQAITSTHRVARFAAFDQFPYTPHLECGVYLTRR